MFQCKTRILIGGWFTEISKTASGEEVDEEAGGATGHHEGGQAQSSTCNVKGEEACCSSSE
jgi:hypothetical protein